MALMLTALGSVVADADPADADADPDVTTPDPSAPTPTCLDDPLPLRVLAREIPPRRAGRKCSLQCMYRWTNKGCRGERLRYVQIGATRCTTRRWIAEFFARLTARSEAGPLVDPGVAAAPLAGRTPARRARETAKADAALARAGY